MKIVRENVLSDGTEFSASPAVADGKVFAGYLDEAFNQVYQATNNRWNWPVYSSLELSLTAAHTGSALDSSIATGDVELDAYTLVNASAVWQASPRLAAYLVIDNVTDEHYEQFIGFRERGIMPRVGVKLSL